MSGQESVSDAQVLESLNEGVVAFNDRRRVLLANASLISLIRLEGRPVVGEPAEALFGGRPELLEVLEQGFRGRLLSEPADLLFREPGGGMRHLGVTTSRLPAGAGGGVVMVVQDVSALKRMEREMFQVAKMSALGRLAASVAHEVRNPLGAIDIQLQLLEDDLAGVDAGLRDKVYRRLNIAQMEMKRLDRIVHNFLRFSRTPRLRLQRLSLNEVVRHVFELVSPEAREQGVQLRLDLQPDLPPVDGDESQLGQAVLNMTVNAFQAMDGEGTLCAQTRLDAASGQVCLALVDTGCGIPEGEMDRIFEFYYTTRDDGTGLGLSIAQRIVYQHGGRIEVESQEGAGATFRVYMPVAAGEGDRDGE